MKVLIVPHLCYESFEGLNQTDEELNDAGVVESNLEEAKFQNFSNESCRLTRRLRWMLRTGAM